MIEIIVFGGTSEGRELCELLGKKRIDTLICVATEYGGALLTSFDSLRIHTGRLNQEAMEELLEAENPRLVIDATHPYAAKVSENIFAACAKTGVRLIRLLREKLHNDGCQVFSCLEELISWLNTRQGTIFSTLGSKECGVLTTINGYKERVWLRILPDLAGLSACLSQDFPARRIICMQGPFSKELNTAMFRAAKADILLTKDSGTAGGYLEKLEAAKECGMTVAILARPHEEDGLKLDSILKLIEEDAI